MEKILIIILLSVYTTTSAQRTKTEQFIVESDTIQYTRIDHSNYGTTGVYITMFENNQNNKDLIHTANVHLLGIPRLYHTLYFFVPVKETFDQDYREKIFAAFIKHIVTKEKVSRTKLYLNFDSDYSKKYEADLLVNNSLPIIKRLKTKITGKKIRNVLLN